MQPVKDQMGNIIGYMDQQGRFVRGTIAPGGNEKQGGLLNYKGAFSPQPMDPGTEKNTTREAIGRIGPVGYLFEYGDQIPGGDKVLDAAGLGDEDKTYGRHYDRISTSDADYAEDYAENQAQGKPVQRMLLNLDERWLNNPGETVPDRIRYRNYDRVEDANERMYNRQTRKHEAAEDLGLQGVADFYDSTRKNWASRGKKWGRKQREWKR